ncbi:MAG: spore germination protein [Bacillus sp. (in: Bacteria)]|nr:spore germination protein [Bacillus sp. (in: firmicutes)]
MTIWTVVLLFLAFPEIDILRFTPYIFQGEIDPIRKGIEAYAAFLGYELILFLFPYIEKDKRVTKAIIGGHLISTFIYLGVCLVSFGFYSFEQLKIVLYPTIKYLKFIQTPILERIERLTLSLFVLKVAITVVMYYWVSLQLSARMFTKSNKPWFVFSFILFTFLVTLPFNLYRDVSNVFGYLNLPEIILAFFLPILLLFFIWQKNRKERKQSG